MRGDVRSVARLITLSERGDPRAIKLLRSLSPTSDPAHVIGITGIPGSGKSTLIDQLIATAISEGLKVGVLAVDPTSPFTGGAVLADRIRMQRHSNDNNGTFIRSFGSRGNTGGLSMAVADATFILDVSGRDVIFIETVGAGQLETDIVSNVHTVVVTTVPGLGDSVQFIKAGLMEISDIFVVNMSDRPGVSHTVRHLESLNIKNLKSPAWVNPVLSTVATKGKGVNALWKRITEHRIHMRQIDLPNAHMQDLARTQLIKRIEQMWQKSLGDILSQRNSVKRLSGQVASGSMGIHEAVEILWDELGIFNK